MKPPPQHKQFQTSKILACLECEVFICYFGTSGSGHHHAPIDTFHPHRLPPSESQAPLENKVATHFGLHEHLRANENVIFTKQSHLCPKVFEQPIEISLMKIEILSKTLLHNVPLIVTHTTWVNQCTRNHGSRTHFPFDTYNQ